MQALETTILSLIHTNLDIFETAYLFTGIYLDQTLNCSGKWFQKGAVWVGRFTGWLIRDPKKYAVSKISRFECGRGLTIHVPVVLETVDAAVVVTVPAVAVEEFALALVVALFLLAFS